MEELVTKLNAISSLLDQRGLDALLLQRVSSLAWATGGATTYINTAATNGVASLLFTPTGRYLITNNIEAPRLQQEDKFSEQGWQFVAPHWYEAGDLVVGLTKGLKLGADGAYPGAVDLSAEVARLRVNLTGQEIARFRRLSALTAQAMQAAISAVKPGQSEHEIAALLAQESQRRGVQAIVNLVASDERVFNFRHPLPTPKTLERYAMLVLCGRQAGLVCSITRLVHFGPLPAELRRKSEAVARIDAAMIHATRPGRSLGEIFEITAAGYAENGFPMEWQHHHQGGPAGYEPREYLAVPGSQDVVRAGQVFAWNPSIRGAKSEDSVLITAGGYEVLTSIEAWPTLAVEVNGETCLRPAILER